MYKKEITMPLEIPFFAENYWHKTHELCIILIDTHLTAQKNHMFVKSLITISYTLLHSSIFKIKQSMIL